MVTEALITTTNFHERHCMYMYCCARVPFSTSSGEQVLSLKQPAKPVQHPITAWKVPSELS
eukprot:2173434-Prymnesium_polylepis.1